MCVPRVSMCDQVTPDVNTHPIEVVLLVEEPPVVAALQFFEEGARQRGREGGGDGNARGHIHQSLDTERQHRPLAIEALEPVQGKGISMSKIKIKINMRSRPHVSLTC